MAKYNKKRAPFVMKGFSYPGKSPLHDAKQSTMSSQGTAGGWESTPRQDWRSNQQLQRGLGSGRISQLGSLIKAGMGFGGFGGGGMWGMPVGGILAGLGSMKNKGGYRKPINRRGSRGYDLGTPNQGYVSQHPTFMTS
jgi:hypothetical protein